MEKSHLVKHSSNGNNFIELVQVASFEKKIPCNSIDEIKNKLKVIIALLGFKPDHLPDEDERDLLIQYMKSQMVNYSLSDLGLAFTLYIQGKLDYNEKHYGKFSVLFLENVMQSYKRYKVALPKQPIEHQLPEVSKEETERLVRHGALTCFQTYFQYQKLFDFGNVTYDYLDRHGHINLTDARKRIIWDEAKKNLKSQAGIKAMSGRVTTKLTDILERIETKNEGVKSEAKRIALREYFDFLIQTEQQLKDIIA